MIKYFLLVLILGTVVFLFNCGLFDKPQQYESCTIDGNLIICPDGTSTEIKSGAPGLDAPPAKDGKDGKDGANGTSCYTYTTLNGAVISCQDSSSEIHNGVTPLITILTATPLECEFGGYVVVIDSTESLVCNGKDGVKGDTGQQGIPGSTGLPGAAGSPGPIGSPGILGTNGHSSLFTAVAATSIECSNGGTHLLAGLDLDDDNLLEGNEVTSSVTLCNGNNGTNSAPTPFTPVGVVDPCGDASGIYDEVFIRFSNGTLLASFSDNANGKNTRFSMLTAGSYITTDGSSCFFSVDSNGNIYNEHY